MKRLIIKECRWPNLIPDYMISVKVTNVGCWVVERTLIN